MFIKLNKLNKELYQSFTSSLADEYIKEALLAWLVLNDINIGRPNDQYLSKLSYNTAYHFYSLSVFEMNKYDWAYILKIEQFFIDNGYEAISYYINKFDKRTQKEVRGVRFHIDAFEKA